MFVTKTGIFLMHLSHSGIKSLCMLSHPSHDWPIQPIFDFPRPLHKLPTLFFACPSKKNKNKIFEYCCIYEAPQYFKILFTPPPKGATAPHSSQAQHCTS